MLREFRVRPRLIGGAYRSLRALGACALVALAASPLTPRIGFAAAAIPQPAHIVIVVEENRSENGIIGNKSAPFITSLAAGGII